MIERPAPGCAAAEGCAATSWQLLAGDVVTPRSGAYNMAVDHALLEHVQRERTPVLRFYRWRPACLSFGRHQPACGVYDPAMAAELGIDIVRRPTGGLAVLHDQELTYAFVAPAELLGGPRATYTSVNHVLAAGLRRIGVPAELSGGGRRSPFGTLHPCFAEPATGEVSAAGRKIVGSAQRSEQRTLLQHGSILLAGSQAVVARMAAVPFDLGDRAITVSELLEDVPPAVCIAQEIGRAFEEHFGISLAPFAWTGALAVRVAELEPLYRSAEWTWRR